MKLKEGGSVNEHVRTMTELFDELAVIDNVVTEEDRVVHLLASLPESYNVIFTALESQSEKVPKWEVVTERLLHQEQKLKEKAPCTQSNDWKALFVSPKRPRKPPRKKQFTCHYCNKPGHFKRDYYKFLASQKKEGASIANTNFQNDDGEALVTTPALAATSRRSWIIDSGATCHMCNNVTQFHKLRPLETPMEVTLGDGRSLKAIAEGTVRMETLLPDGNTHKCKFDDVLFIPELSYSLLSVSKTSEIGNTVKFSKSGCEILNMNKKVVTFATKAGNLYYLEHYRKTQNVNLVEVNKKRLWYRRYGHINRRVKRITNWSNHLAIVHLEVLVCVRAVLAASSTGLLLTAAADRQVITSSWFTQMYVEKSVKTR